MIDGDVVTSIVDPALRTAESITNFGLLATIGGFFVVISASMIVFCFRWFSKIINQTMTTQQDSIKQLLEVQTKCYTLIYDVHSNINDEALQQIKVVADLSFDMNRLSIENIMDNIVNQNGLKDNEDEIRKKIEQSINNLASKRNITFDLFTFSGRKMTEFLDKDWTEMVTDLVYNEIYHKNGFSRIRAITNVALLFDDIKDRYYGNLKNKIF
jgi:hypothetical protein